MIRIKTQINNAVTEFKMKSSWPELSQDDLTFAANLIFDNIDSHSAKVQLLIQLVQADDRKTKLVPLVEQLWLKDPDSCILLFDQIDFITLKLPNYYESLFPEFNGFQGLENGLENMKWLQFRHAERHFHNYITHRQEFSLNALMSFIFWKNEFIIEQSPKTAKIAASWLNSDRQAALLNYAALRHWVMNIVEDEDDPINDDLLDNPAKAFQAQSLPDNKLWSENISFNLADGGKFGSFMEIDNLTVPAVLNAIDQKNEIVMREQLRN